MKKLFKYSMAVLGSATLIASANAIKTSNVEKVENENVSVELTSSKGGPEKIYDYSYYDMSKLREISRVLGRVRPGDIFYDNEGTPIGLGVLFGGTGHCGIVIDVVSDPYLGYSKLKIVEANGYDGVQIHEVDARRFYHDKQILRVQNLTESQRNTIVDFAEEQVRLAKGYNWDFNMKKEELDFVKAKENPDYGKWFCSELVWAAYKKVGIDLDENNATCSWVYSGCLPWEVMTSSKVTAIMKSVDFDNHC